MRGAAGMSPFEERPSLVLDRLADRADYAVIGPMDGRTRVANARTHPYAAICYLEPDFRDRLHLRGTGFLIFPDVVLTAAHNVYMLRPGRTGRSVPPRYRVTPGRNGAGAPPFGTQPAIQLYAPQRFVGASDRAVRFRLHQNGPAVPGPSRRIPSRRADRRASAAGAVAPVSAYRGLSLRQAARGPCGSMPSGSIGSRRIPSITASTRGRDMPEVRSGCGAIVPARWRQSASMPPGRRDTRGRMCARHAGIVRAPRRNQSRRAGHARIDRDGPGTSSAERRILTSCNSGEGRGERSCSQTELAA